MQNDTCGRRGISPVLARTGRPAGRDRSASKEIHTEGFGTHGGRVPRKVRFQSDDQRALAALRAASERSSALIRDALVAPPFFPPARPARTTDLSGSVGVSSVASPTIAAAR